jgi:hypothetical protein
VAWTRHDDGEVLDRKIGELTDAEYRGRHALIQLCAREYKDHGLFPAGDIRFAAWASPKGPRSVTVRMLVRFQELGLVRSRSDYSDDEIVMLGLEHEWPEDDDRLRVHNWEKYNPPREVANLDQRVQLFLEAHPGASANEVCREIPGQRRAILAAIKRVQPGGSGTGSHTSTGTDSPGVDKVVPEPGEVVPASGSRTGTRAGTYPRSRPVPSPKHNSEAVALHAAIHANGDPADAPDVDRTALDQFLESVELKEIT